MSRARIANKAKAKPKHDFAALPSARATTENPVPMAVMPIDAIPIDAKSIAAVKGPPMLMLIFTTTRERTL